MNRIVMIHTVFYLKSCLFFLIGGLALPASATFVGSCETVWQQARMECNITWGGGREDGSRGDGDRKGGNGESNEGKKEDNDGKARKYSGSREMAHHGRRYLNMSAEESHKLAECMKKVRQNYCSKDECDKGTACYKMRYRERRLRQAARQQERYGREMERVQRQTQDQDPKKFAERLKRQQELTKALKDIFSPPEQKGLSQTPPPAAVAELPPVTPDPCGAGNDCGSQLQTGEVSRRGVDEEETAKSSAETDLSERIAALKAALLSSPENSKANAVEGRNPAAVPALFSRPAMPAGILERAGGELATRELDDKDKKKPSTGESIGMISGGGENKGKKGKQTDNGTEEIDEDFKLDPDDKNPHDDKKINIANFLPKNDPRLSFADFIETQPYEPPLTSASGPSLWQKLNWRYKAIEPLMEK